MQDTPGAAIKASELEQLDPAAFNRLPIIDVLASAGLFIDHRKPSIMSWFDRTSAGLPEPMSDEVRAWFEVLLHGSAVPPRSRPRAEVTVRLRLHYALPLLSVWSGEGRTSLREVTRDDVRRALPNQGSNRSLTVQALKSMFRTLRARRLLFADPTTRTRTGRPETRFPLPIDDIPFRSALESNDPARAVIAALVGFHALTNAQVRGLLLTDVRDGRIQLGNRAIPMARPVRDRVGRWLDHRRSTWPETANPHLLLNRQTAVRTTPVSHVWVLGTLGMSAQAVREDRILHEANTTRDIRRLCDLFGLSVKGAQRYIDAVASYPSTHD